MIRSGMPTPLTPLRRRMKPASLTLSHMSGGSLSIGKAPRKLESSRNAFLVRVAGTSSAMTRLHVQARSSFRRRSTIRPYDDDTGSRKKSIHADVSISTLVKAQSGHGVGHRDRYQGLFCRARPGVFRSFYG